MGKLSSFATGMGEGYLGARRYKDSQARMERQDAALDKIAGIDPPKPEEKVSLWDRAMRLIGRDEDEIPGKANGGIIGAGDIATPVQHDNMSWQRGSFKK